MQPAVQVIEEGRVVDSTCGLGETGRQGKMELTKGQDFEDAGFDFNNTLITVCIVWDTD